MKRKNMKAGLHVVIKDCAVGCAGERSGKTVVIERVDDDGDGWVLFEQYACCGDDLYGNCFVLFPNEARKATPEEIAKYEAENAK